MELICALLLAFLVVVFLRIILSWFPPTGGFIDQVQRFAWVTTEWAMGPLRRIIPGVQIGAVRLDLSPFVVILGVQILRAILCA